MQVVSYSWLDRLLHWVALQPSIVRQLSFELERMYALPRPTQPGPAGYSAASDGAVYVCGLARSGTTMLLRLLAQSGDFRSLTYRDMPFVLAPNLWRALSQRAWRGGSSHERAHGDGILIDFDSPESFEEVFWRTFGDTAKRLGDSYGMEEIDDDVMRAFSDYRALVANPSSKTTRQVPERKRYLSKNNNNLLRLKRLSEDATACVLLVYRDPVATARSLHRLHIRFCTEHDGGFSKAYMGWLGHFEFGPGHLPFSFARPHIGKSLTPADQDYWLSYWNAVYLHVLAHEGLRIKMVNHDVMCRAPVKMLAAIFEELGISANIESLAVNINTPSCPAEAPLEFDGELLHTAQSIYRRLSVSHLNVFRPAAERTP